MPVIPIERIVTDGNVRREVGDVSSLAASIERVGLISPLNVAVRGEDYMLIAGHRRLAALKQLGEQEVAVTINPYVEQDADRISMQYAENVERKDLSAFEKAQVALDLKAEGMTQKDVATELQLQVQDVSKMQKAARFVSSLPNAAEATKLTETALFELAELGTQEDIADAELVAENALRSIVNGDARSVDQAFGKAEREANEAAALERLMPLLDELAALKITVLTEQPARASIIGQHQANGLMVSGDLPSSEEWVIQHRQLDCHALRVQKSYQGPILYEYCVKPNAHKEKGKSGLKEASADQKHDRREKEKKDRKAVKDAKDLRLNDVEHFMKSAWNQGGLVKDIPKAIPLSNDMKRVICRAMKIEKIESKYGNYPDYDAMVASWLDTQSDKKQNLFPIVAAMAYRYVEIGYGGVQFEEVFGQ